MRRFLPGFMLLLCILSLPGCGRREPDPAVSRAPYFSEVYNVHTLCSVYVNNAFSFEQEDSTYLILECSIQEILAPSSGNTDLRAEDEILVWAAVTSGQEDALTELFLSADSLIVNGGLQDVPLAAGSPDEEAFLAQLGQSAAPLPPCLFPQLRYWGILPFREDALDSASLESILDGDVVFSLEETRPEEGLYFQNGDTLSQVCSALERYIRQTDFSLL